MNKTVPNNPHSRRKVRQTLEFIERELEPEPAFKAAVITESVAQGDARAGSDVDIILVFEPLRLDVVPGDFLWSARSPGYRVRHERNADDPEEVHFDANRVDLAAYRRGECGEEWRYLLSGGLLVYDRDGDVEPVLDRLIAYPPELRRSRVGENVYYVDYHLDETKALSWFDRSGALAAHSHVTAAIAYLIKMLYAYHSRYLTWPNKQVPVLLRFPDPVGDLAEALERGTLVLAMTKEDVLRRLRVLRGYFDRLVPVLQRDGLLPPDKPFDYAFGMAWPQIGMRHSMVEWRIEHEGYLRQRRRSLEESDFR